VSLGVLRCSGEQLRIHSFGASLHPGAGEVRVDDDDQDQSCNTATDCHHPATNLAGFENDFNRADSPNTGYTDNKYVHTKVSSYKSPGTQQPGDEGTRVPLCDCDSGSVAGQKSVRKQLPAKSKIALQNAPMVLVKITATTKNWSRDGSPPHIPVTSDHPP